MKARLSYLILALRIAVVWWLLFILVTAIFSGSVAFLGALLFFPPIALIIGCTAAWLQYRSLVSMPDGAARTNSALSSSQRQSISLALPTTQAMRIAKSALESEFGQVEQRVTENTITARVIENGVKTTGFAALRSDQLAIKAVDDGNNRSTLQIVCEPVHVWLYGLFWVEAGRSARQADALRFAILARVRAQNDIADSRDRQNTLQSRLADAELLLLRAQVEPHFLFNTLAHIRASIASSPHIALEMLDALIVFLRANSKTASSANTSLADELQRTESYLKIIQIRLGARLRYVVECAPLLLTRQVPNACVLILVENAVKHGIERSDTSGMISVNCKDHDGMLVIDVDNDGPGLASTQTSGEGGLNNLRERLQLTYGIDAKMTIEGRDEGGVRASLRIPARVFNDRN